MNYSIVSSLISYNKIDTGTSKRFNCPICEGINSLSVTNFGDCIKFNCFKASCNVKGVIKNELSNKSFKIIDNLPNIKNSTNKIVLNKEDTKYWRTAMFPADLDRYITNNNCSYAYKSGLADIRYDYQKNRAVFVIKNSRNEVLDATGRALYTDALPKWYRYGRSRLPYVCGTKHSRHAVVVEDCASATAISHLVTGVALLGTHLTEEAEKVLSSKFDRVSVALDKDATMKSLSLIKQLKWSIANLNIIILERDLKNEDKGNLKGVLKLND